MARYAFAERPVPTRVMGPRRHRALPRAAFFNAVALSAAEIFLPHGEGVGREWAKGRFPTPHPPSATVPPHMSGATLPEGRDVWGETRRHLDVAGEARKAAEAGCTIHRGKQCACRPGRRSALFTLFGMRRIGIPLRRRYAAQTPDVLIDFNGGAEGFVQVIHRHTEEAA